MATLHYDIESSSLDLDPNHPEVIAAQERIWGPRPVHVQTHVPSATDYYGVNTRGPGLNRRQRRANASKARKAGK